MPLSHSMTLGRSDLAVGPVCLGGRTFGEAGGRGSRVAESDAILARFLERGGRLIDSSQPSSAWPMAPRADAERF